VTAALVGLVLITFTGGTVRALQVISWLPTTRFMEGSLPQWLGTWFGIYNTWECMIGQAFAVALVLGTWRIARFKAKRDAAKRRAQHMTQDSDAVTA
jgi:high-affinity iron transporter